MNLSAITKLHIRRLPYYWVHMNRIYSLTIRMFIKDSTNCSEHMMHRLSKVFTTMSGNKYQLIISHPIKFRMCVVFFNRMLHSVNNCVPSHKNTFSFASFLQKIISAQRCRSKIINTDNAYAFTIKLFRIGAIYVISSQACFNMANRNLKIKASQRCNKCCRCISMNQNDIRSFFL